PYFAHEALLVGSEGKLSKRLGSLGVDALREAGIEPIALLAKLARIGTSVAVEPVTSAEPLIATFDFETFGRAPARFDMEELTALNARILHQTDFAAVAARLPEGITEDVWKAIRPNLKRLDEARDWWSIIKGPVAHRAEAGDRSFLEEAAAVAESLDWSADVWRALTGELKARTGRSGKALFLPLRQALTGRDSGPEMAVLLPLIGKEQSLARLRAAA
ncbi:MAG: glutamate--tRNA ligase, partial [Sphingomonadales bacterium]